MLRSRLPSSSTDEQDADRGREALQAFVSERGMEIAAAYVENESGASLKRPELFRLLADCKPGDVLLVEQVDRLSRLSAGTGSGSRKRSPPNGSTFLLLGQWRPGEWMISPAGYSRLSTP